MMAIQEDGWVRVPYEGPELGVVEMAFGEDEPTTWKPAFINTIGSIRYAQVRPTGVAVGEMPRVWLRTNGVAVLIGRLGDVESRQRRR
jgi:hypothetical protein